MLLIDLALLCKDGDGEIEHVLLVHSVVYE